jgi:3-hydroxybutyryl-CoA dehydrogenase
MGIQKVLVVGSGLMGSGIAQVCAQAGIQVLLYDVSKDALANAIKTIDWSVGKFIEAMNLVEQGVASVADIDKGLRLAAGRRMGIFETGDMVGLDVTYGAMKAMFEETGDPRWYPPLLLRRKVKAGHLGRKAGKGWYEYNEDGSRKGQAP